MDLVKSEFLRFPTSVGLLDLIKIHKILNKEVISGGSLENAVNSSPDDDIQRTSFGSMPISPIVTPDQSYSNERNNNCSISCSEGFLTPFHDTPITPDDGGEGCVFRAPCSLNLVSHVRKKLSFTQDEFMVWFQQVFVSSFEVIFPAG